MRHQSVGWWDMSIQPHSLTPGSALARLDDGMYKGPFCQPLFKFSSDTVCNLHAHYVHYARVTYITQCYGLRPMACM